LTRGHHASVTQQAIYSTRNLPPNWVSDVLITRPPPRCWTRPWASMHVRAGSGPRCGGSPHLGLGAAGGNGLLGRNRTQWTCSPG